ncbi:MAG: pseudouridine synthase [Bdellovibrionota bacterium]
MNFRILYQDEHLVAIDKPAGYHVHPPEDPRHGAARAFVALSLLRKQLDQYLYPVHRLDRATSGVLLFALSKDSAAALQRSFQEGLVKKTYFAVARGWISEARLIDHALKNDERVYEAQTEVDPLARMELPSPVGRYETARYTLLKASPRTGRMHQIRRHCDSISHPLVGDSVYGDGAHNRFFKEKLKLPGLFLKAYALRFPHPVSGAEIRLHSRWGEKWLRVFELFGVCPLETEGPLFV